MLHKSQHTDTIFETNIDNIQRKVILAIITCRSSMWISLVKLEFRKIKFRNFATRVAPSNVNKNDHTTARTNKPKLFKSSLERCYDTCMIIHKIIQGHYPTWLLPLPPIGNTTGVQARQVISSHGRRSRIEIGVRQIQIRGQLHSLKRVYEKSKGYFLNYQGWSDIWIQNGTWLKCYH